jgi:SlyX protein
LNERLQLLEEKIAYLERHVTEQDKAMLELAEELAALRREVKGLTLRSASGTAGPASNDAPDWGERPPHY